MKLIQVMAFFLAATLTTSVQASEVKTLLVLFDTICINGRLDAQSVEQLSRVSAEQLVMNLKPVPADKVRTMGMAAKAAWLLNKGQEVYISEYTEKPVGQQVSHGCSITMKGATLADVRGEVERRYKVTKADEGTQGFSNYVGYFADLVGFQETMGIGIQETSEDTPKKP